MIVSHKHKFIFIKPPKVAGTSVEITLAKHCGPEDVVTRNSEFDPTLDSRSYEHERRNDERFYSHATPKEIRAEVGEEIWNTYFKIAIVRNPWDQVVSRYFWQKRYGKPLTKSLQPKKLKQHVFNPLAYRYVLRRVFFSVFNRVRGIAPDSFATFVKYYKPEWTATQYALDENGQPYCDFYIRYEQLDEDYKRVCAKLGIPHEPLPLTKNKLRTDHKPYQDYYTRNDVRLIDTLYKPYIAYFGYTFTPANDTRR